MKSRTELDEKSTRIAVASLVGDPLGLGNLTAKTLPIIVEQSRKFAQEIEAEAHEADKAFLMELLRLPEILQEEILEAIQQRELSTTIETETFKIEVTFKAKPGAELEPSLTEALAQVTKDFRTKIGKGLKKKPKSKAIDFLRDIRVTAKALNDDGKDITAGSLAEKLRNSEGKITQRHFIRKCRHYFGGTEQEAYQRAITLSARF